MKTIKTFCNFIMLMNVFPAGIIYAKRSMSSQSLQKEELKGDKKCADL